MAWRREQEVVIGLRESQKKCHDEYCSIRYDGYATLSGPQICSRESNCVFRFRALCLARCCPWPRSQNSRGRAGPGSRQNFLCSVVQRSKGARV